MDAEYDALSGKFTFVPESDEDEALLAVLAARWDLDWFDMFDMTIDSEAVTLELSHGGDDPGRTTP